MKIGIVILNYNCFEDSIRCIYNIKDTVKLIEYHIYLIDNCSSDESVKILKKEFKGFSDITIIENSENRGYAYGNNIGMKAAIKDGCKMILISNPDVEYYQNAIFNMATFLEQEDVGVVGPTILDINGNLDLHSMKTMEYKGIILNKKPFSYFNFKYAKQYRMEEYTCNEPVIFDGMVMGCSFMITAKAIENVGYFDEGTFLFFEENILGKKLKRKNIKVAINPNAKVTHRGASTTKSINIKLFYYRYCSELYGLCNYCSISRIQILQLFIINLIGLILKGINCRHSFIVICQFVKYYFCVFIKKRANRIIKI